MTTKEPRDKRDSSEATSSTTSTTSNPSPQPAFYPDPKPGEMLSGGCNEGIPYDPAAESYPEWYRKPEMLDGEESPYGQASELSQAATQPNSESSDDCPSSEKKSETP